MNTIVFFDFDGTITKRDSFRYFLYFYYDTWTFMSKMSRCVFSVARYFIGLYSATQAKNKILTAFFTQVPLAEFEDRIKAFAATRLPPLVRKTALTQLLRYKEEGATVVIVSASPEPYLRAWAQQYQIEVIGTQLEVKGGKLTGKILGQNCKGQEKKRRILAQFDLSLYDTIISYGDSAGDYALYELSTEYYHRYF